MESPTATIQLSLAPKSFSRMKKSLTTQLQHRTIKLQQLCGRYNYAVNYMKDAKAKLQINNIMLRIAEDEYKRKTGSSGADCAGGRATCGFNGYCDSRPVLALAVRKQKDILWAIGQTETHLRSVWQAIIIVRKEVDRLTRTLEDLKGGKVVPGVVEDAELEGGAEGQSSEGEIVEGMAQLLVGENVELAEGPAELEAEIVEKQPTEEEAKVAVEAPAELEAEVIVKQPTEEEAKVAIAVEAPAEVEAKVVKKQPAVEEEEEEEAWNLV
ncbi:uncharacterized protein H6S33_007644 [Morchella sextelata]|uniref:uncharacterized protein n=1 Tax=Morchella sextelata TaxID=1174677 RepID=UPI001D0385DC|nr:uncharacterized protein H6S33_007644 [Morchella sextelata]KAH0603322.1 hypothetical protein H6S33_007644 [Morchella sextelata]